MSNDIKVRQACVGVGERVDRITYHARLDRDPDVTVPYMMDKHPNLKPKTDMGICAKCGREIPVLPDGTAKHHKPLDKISSATKRRQQNPLLRLRRNQTVYQLLLPHATLQKASALAQRHGMPLDAMLIYMIDSMLENDTVDPRVILRAMKKRYNKALQIESEGE